YNSRRGTHDRNPCVRAGRLPVHPRRVSLFGRGRGAPGPRNRAGAVPHASAAGRGFRPDPQHSGRGGTAAHRAVRLRTALARAVHGGGMQRRLSALGFGWHDTTATQVYTVHDLYPFLAEEIVRRGAARAGLAWHFARPPVVELEYEMDCRGVGREQVII